ncbi:MAG TPA: thrombospondin type 3 repeat-containing protein, partial [candidate division Zixibacteria bacterium]|nr:thrombospondin type 3 repeat-containing protein [candidate division Zixibacteria bacterium]
MATWTDTRNGNQDVYGATWDLPLTEPRLHEPLKGAQFDSSTGFTWSTAWKESEAMYFFQVAYDSLFTSLIRNVVLYDNRFNDSLVGAIPEEYFWRVKAYRAPGGIPVDSTAFSAPGRFLFGDVDLDGDGHIDRNDNCPNIYNPAQQDFDGDTYGDSCDNCPFTYNFWQEDSDSNGIGNLCDDCGIMPDAGAMVDTAWSRRFNDTRSLNDEGNDLQVGAEGGVYITGTSAHIGQQDLLVLKYSGGGDLLWEFHYDGTDHGADQGRAIAIDSAGNSYVAATINLIPELPGLSGELAALKLGPAGTGLWLQSHVAQQNNAEANAIAVDGAGAVHVAGRSQETAQQMAILKYASDGILQWSRFLYGVGGINGFTGIHISSDTTIYCSGYRYGITRNLSSLTDYALIPFDSVGGVRWQGRYDGPAAATDTPLDMAVGTTGNIHLTGTSDGGLTGMDFATVKFSPAGDPIWLRRYDGTASAADSAVGIAVDACGRVFVTGSSVDPVTGTDIVTLAYDSEGGLLWERRYDHGLGLTDRASAVALDSRGNVYVTGRTDAAPADKWITLKYNAEGALLWVTTYDAANSGNGGPSAMVVDNDANIYITGKAWIDSTRYDCVTIKYVQSACPDGDTDGICDAADNCPADSNPAQTDADADGIGDACDDCTDTDGDGFGNPGYPANICTVDNCPEVPNAEQVDTDGDGVGDLCDNCLLVANTDQTDADLDGYGAACDCNDNDPLDAPPTWFADVDGDGFGDSLVSITQCTAPLGYVANGTDNCPAVTNPDQQDSDGDGIGDLCDPCSCPCHGDPSCD